VTRQIAVAMLAVLATACASPAQTGSSQPSEQASPPVSTAIVTISPSEMPSTLPSGPRLVSVTFRLTLTGTVPADAAFAIESGEIGKEGGAVYLCSYYGGWPLCEIGKAFDEVVSFPADAVVHYRIWRELDVTGTSVEVESGELAVGTTDQVVPVTYDIQP
jgi:hypothetical protein